MLVSSSLSCLLRARKGYDRVENSKKDVNVLPETSVNYQDILALIWMAISHPYVAIAKIN
jgi:hypothetical protein